MSGGNKAGPSAEELIAKYGRSLPVGPRCTVGCSPRRALIEQLMEAGATSARISVILREEFNIRIGEFSLARHHRRACRCQP